MKYFKEGVLKYFKISMNFFKYFKLKYFIVHHYILYIMYIHAKFLLLHLLYFMRSFDTLDVSVS